MNLLTAIIFNITYLHSKYYNIMAIPQLQYGSETWIRTAKDMSRIQGGEMRFLRAVKGCTRRGFIRNDQIRMELGLSLIHI